MTHRAQGGSNRRPRLTSVLSPRTSCLSRTWDINRGLPVVLDDGNQHVYGAGLESMVTGSGTYYYLADGLGSTMAIVDTSGMVQKSYTYDVHGKPTATGRLSNEFDFAGQRQVRRP